MTYQEQREEVDALFAKKSITAEEWSTRMTKICKEEKASRAPAPKEEERPTEE